ncbi:hypothetical protein Plec18167_000809 [Paecilomyces lecythidis]|uniref:Uncharacterized protein n=1 Tax=Paecilomyces lecythidis TaxID=3004212 RepID=A0ABR3YFG5_9EURO
MTYQFSVGIFGPGTFERAHWGFVIHKPPNQFGDLLHVRVVDIPSNKFIFEHRSGHALDDQDAWGLCRISLLGDVRRSKVISMISSEQPPFGGTKDCQDWILDALVSLEVEELVPEGTAQIWASRVGKETKVVEGEAGIDWEPLNGR